VPFNCQPVPVALQARGILGLPHTPAGIVSFIVVVTLSPGLIFTDVGLMTFHPGNGGKLKEIVTGLDHSGSETIKFVFAVPPVPSDRKDLSSSDEFSIIFSPVIA